MHMMENAFKKKNMKITLYNRILGLIVVLIACSNLG